MTPGRRIDAVCVETAVFFGIRKKAARVNDSTELGLSKSGSGCLRNITQFYIVASIRDENDKEIM
jgi:hypothetical protein